jgi:signal transduction histidine kinase
MADEIERQMQVLKDEADGKQQFVDNFAHEMRTPLTSILGYAEYMQKASLSEEESIESAQYIIDEANHMRNIANSLLTLATLRGYTAVTTELTVSQLFNDIRQSLEKVLDAGNVRFVCNSEVDILHGQEDLIKSLLLNLCTNALNACPADGSGTITLNAKSVERGAPDAPQAVVISVIDNGRGIPKESLSKLTEPFYRVDKARNREMGGAGLGLALCSRIAEAHGAALTFESTADVGTKALITFTTPLQLPNKSII